MRVFVTFVAVALLGQSVAQATNIALNAPVINQSSIGNLIGPNFVVANVDDGQGVTTNQLGVTASENYNDGSYWLNYSTGTEFFILDLGALRPSDRFVSPIRTMASMAIVRATPSKSWRRTLSAVGLLGFWESMTTERTW